MVGRAIDGFRQCIGVVRVNQPGQSYNRIPVISLLIANTISRVGSTLTGIAVPWFVLITTGSAAKTGLTGAVAMLPIVLAGIFGGTIVDRVGYRRMSILGDVAAASTVALIPLLYHSVGLAFWQLLVLLFLGQVFNTPSVAARFGLVPDLAELGVISLERVNSAQGASFNVAGLVGPLIAGIFIGAIGASNVLWLDAASFALSALLVMVVVPTTASYQGQTAPSAGYRAELAEGLRFLRDDTTLVIVFLVAAATNLSMAPMGGVILPVYAEHVFGNVLDLGVILSVMGGGALAGTLLYGMFVPRMRRYSTFVGALLLFALIRLGLVLLPGIVATAVLLGASSLVHGPINPIINTTVQRRVPMGVRGRVFGLLNSISTATVPFGIFVAGILLQSIGLRITIVAEMSLSLVVAGSLLFVPALRTMDQMELTPSSGSR